MGEISVSHVYSYIERASLRGVSVLYVLYSAKDKSRSASLDEIFHLYQMHQ